MFRQIISLMLVMWGLTMMPVCSRTEAVASPGPDSGAAAPPPEGQPAQPSRWPMHVTSADGADVTIFQPQLEDFQGDTLTARAAVAVTPAGQQQPVFGAIWLQSRVQTDRSARTVQILDVQVSKELFPSQQPISQQSLSDAARQAILAQPITLSLDHLLASLEALQKAQTAAADLQTTPPAIIFKQHPAVKVEYDGDPRLVQTDSAGIMRVINTPFFVALDTSSRMYFLKGAGHWFTAPDPKGPFQFTTQVPQGISQYADQSGYTDPQQAIPDSEVSSLEIVTATTPTELIWTDGQPQMTPISGTNLLYWANTDSDVFNDIATNQTFVLLSGRWYSASNTNGPWTFVAPDQLPADFAQIPPDSPKASVLADVAGTQQAQDALADTYIPQTAAIDSTNYEQPPVTYDGNPDFEPVQGTTCAYAVNSPCSVLSCGGFYYCCYNAVWYQCPTALGPWVISYRVPRDIYTIPPSCPIYPVRFVSIYGYTGSVVYEGYTPGYVGCYPYGGVVVYGTGYAYKPWYRHNYVPRPSTFGFAAQYHPYSGRWGFSFGLASGGGQTWIAAPAKAPVGSNWFGYGGYRPSKVPTTLKINRTIIDTNNVSRATYDVNVYQQRKDVHPEAPGVSPAHSAPQEDHPAPAPAPNHAAVPPDLNENNVYVNDKGDVYRRTDTGWEKRDGDQWKPQPSEPHENPHANPPVQSPPPENPEPPHESPPRQEPVNNQPVNPQPINNQPADNQPQREEPQREQPQQNQPQRQEPQREEPQRQAPPADSGAPDRDYQARERGDSRSSPPPPAPAPAPSHEPSGGGGGGESRGKH